MSSWAVPGALCVCVDDSPSRKSGRMTSYLVRDKIYTIRSIGFEVSVHHKTHVPGEFLTVMLKEVETSSGYLLDRFRPLTKSTKTQEEDIAMFWDILAEEGEKV